MTWAKTSARGRRGKGAIGAATVRAPMGLVAYTAPHEEAVAPLGARWVVGYCREEAPYRLSFFEPVLRF